MKKFKTRHELSTQHFSTENPIPSWYSIEVHMNVMGLLDEEKKLAAVKYLVDLGKQNAEPIGLKEAKELCDFVDGHVQHKFEINQATFLPVGNDLVTDTDSKVSLVDKVADMINDEIQQEYSTSSLRELLSLIPEQALKDFVEKYS